MPAGGSLPTEHPAVGQPPVGEGEEEREREEEEEGEGGGGGGIDGWRSGVGSRV